MQFRIDGYKIHEYSNFGKSFAFFNSPLIIEKQVKLVISVLQDLFQWK